jgi:ABC-type transport system substrate-binding protein
MRKVLPFLAFLVALPACRPRDAGNPGHKTLSYAFASDIQGFDPAVQNDEYSAIAIGQVYEGLLQYDYLKRPHELKPCLAEAMPEVSADGLTFTFKIRSGVLFHDDPVFGGKPRVLRASDVVSSFKRLADPRLKGPNRWIFEGRIEGLEAFQRKVADLPRSIDSDPYDVPGFRATDDRTFVLKLTRPYRQLLHILAMPQTAVIPKELVTKYGEELLNHAAGTGPFVLTEWVRGQKIVFARNPRYRENRYPTAGMPEDLSAGRLQASGKPLPFLDGIVIWIHPETQPRWLNFLRGKLDLAGIPKESYDQVFNDRREVTEEIRKRGIVVDRSEGADLIYFVFNMEDPLVGRNRFLRQAISAILNREEKISLFYNNRAVIADGPIPPTFPGFERKLKDPNGYDPERAKKLIRKALEQYRAEGGKGGFPPLRFDIQSGTVSRQLAEAVAGDLGRIGLKVEMIANPWPKLRERVSLKQAQFFIDAWQADYPDPESFLQLLFGGNRSPGPNHANFKNEAYDRLYERMRDLPDGPERSALIAKMVRIVHAEIPWIFFNHRVGYGVRHAWVRNFKPDPIRPGQFRYLDIDLEEKTRVLPLLR